MAVSKDESLSRLEVLCAEHGLRMTGPRRVIARVLSVIYFLFFLAMPFYSRLDSTKPVPDRLT